MFGFNNDERRAILFVAAVALAGIGINFCLKAYPRAEKLFKAQERMAKIDINLASIEDMLASKLVSQKLAERIVAYRNEHGQFRDFEELKAVKGIGNYRLEKLKEIFFAE
jgi:competence ComEA-like helix-hairpin-helix protein